MVKSSFQLQAASGARAAGQFCYLIVPSVAAMLYADRIGTLSVTLDLPTGATMVCTFGAVLVVMAAGRRLL